LKTYLIIFALLLTGVLILSGCSALEQKLTRPPYCLCDESESLLICDSAELNSCTGYLEDKPIIIEETEL